MEGIGKDVFEEYSLGKDAEQPLFKSFSHLQSSFLFWYVKGAAPHGRPWLVTSSGF